MQIYAKRSPRFRRVKVAQGFALITSILMLLVITIIAIGMFRNFTGQEKIAGNVRDKQRAFDAAATAESYAEWWLINQGYTNLLGTNCTGALTTPTVCTNAPDPTVSPLTSPQGWSPYTPPSGFTMAIANPTNAANNGGGNGVYVSTPFFYITLLHVTYGQSPVYYYQIDATGFGGSPGTLAVVEGTYLVQQANYKAPTGGSYGD